MKDINKLGLVGIAVILFAVVALVMLDDGLYVLPSPHGDMVRNPVFNEDHSAKARDAPTYNQIYTEPGNISHFRAAEPPVPTEYITVDLGTAAKMTTEPGTNITVHIAHDQAQNVTIWKGDKIVCYIPRGVQ